MSDPFQPTRADRARDVMHWMPIAFFGVALLAGTAIVALLLRSGFGTVRTAALIAPTDTPVPTPTIDPIYRKNAELEGTERAMRLTPVATNAPTESPAPTAIATIAVPLYCGGVTPGPKPVACVWPAPSPTPLPTTPTCSTPVPRMACFMPTATAQPAASGGRAIAK